MLSWEGEEGPGSFCDYASRAVEEEFRDNELHINSWLKADAGSTEEDIERWLQIFTSRGRSEYIVVKKSPLKPSIKVKFCYCDIRKPITELC